MTARKMSAVLYMENHKGPRRNLQNLRPLWIPLPIKAQGRFLLAQGLGVCLRQWQDYFGGSREAGDS